MRKTIIIVALILFAALPSWEQTSNPKGKTGGCVATVSTLSLACGTVKGNTGSVSDGTSSTDCTGGGGTTVAFCQYNGSVWAAITGGGGSLPSGTQGDALSNSSGATTYATSTLHKSTNNFAGATLDVRVNNCLKEFAAEGQTEGECDIPKDSPTKNFAGQMGAGVTLNHSIVNFCDVLTTDVPQILGNGVTNATNTAGLFQLHACGIGEEPGGIGVGGAVLEASSNFITNYACRSTNTITWGTGGTTASCGSLSGHIDNTSTDGTHGGKMTVTGDGSTKFTTELKVGMDIMISSTGNAATSDSWGMIESITSDNVLIVSENFNKNTDQTTPANAGYTVWAPLLHLGVVSQLYSGGRANYAIVADGFTADVMGTLGATVAQNWAAAEQSGFHHMVLRGYNNIGLDIEGNQPQDSGPDGSGYDVLFFSPAAGNVNAGGCTAGTIDLVVRAHGLSSPRRFSNFSAANGHGCDDGHTQQAYSFAIDAGVLSIDTGHHERKAVNIGIAAQPACLVGCPEVVTGTVQGIRLMGLDASCNVSPGPNGCNDQVYIGSALSVANLKFQSQCSTAPADNTTSYVNIINDTANTIAYTVANNRCVNEYDIDGAGKVSFTDGNPADLANMANVGVNPYSANVQIAKLNGLLIPVSSAVNGTDANGAIVPSTGHSLSLPLTCHNVTNSGTVQSCNTSPSFTPAARDAILYTSDYANTGDLTLTADGVAGHVRKWMGGSVLASGDLAAGVSVLLTWDGTYWEGDFGVNSAGTLNATCLTTGSATCPGAGVLSLPAGGVIQSADTGTPSFTFGTNQITLNHAFAGTGAFIPVSILNSGTSASSSTFWRGDGTWATPSGASTLDQVGGPAAAASLTEAGQGDIITFAGVEHSANLTAPWVFQNLNSTNNDTNIAAIFNSSGTGTGGIPIVGNSVSGTGDLFRLYSGSTVTTGALSGGTLEAAITATGGLNLGGAASLTVGTAGVVAPTEGTAFTGTSTQYGFYNDSTLHCFDIIDQTTNIGCAIGETAIVGANLVLKAVGTTSKAVGSSITDDGTVLTASEFANFTTNRVFMTADWTCGTGGTVSSCTSATIVGASGTPLTLTLPNSAQSWHWHCHVVVTDTTGTPANNWAMITASHGATNVTASYSGFTAAAVAAGGSTTDTASTTSTFNIGGTWTQAATATKMPYDIDAWIEGASASGTTVSLQVVDPTVGDLLTVYRGAYCTVGAF